MGSKKSGTVKWFNAERGYGFILDSVKENTEYFVHYSSIIMDGYKTLKVGQAVTFELKETEKGVQAINVESA